MIRGRNRSSLAHKLDVLRSHPRPLWFLIARLLRWTGLCRWLTIRQSGFRLVFHPSNLCVSLWCNPLQRRSDIAFFDSYLRPGDRVVDIGANIGLLTLMAAVKVGAGGHVSAIEPHPRTFRFLEENVRFNGVSNVALFHCAVGDRPGPAFLSDLPSDDQNKVIADGPGVAISMRRLDDLPPPDGAIALLKIDVEGYEKAVLDGAAELLERTECVYFESSARLSRLYGRQPEDAWELLERAGFTCYSCDPGGRLSPVRSRRSTPDIENLLAVRDPALLARRCGMSA